jgi:hypothetical protein
MAIKQYLEEAMQKVIVERDREVALVKQKCTQEKIVPHNAEIDTASNNAIAKLQKEFTEKSSAEQQAYNARIAQLQQDFTKKKQEIVDAGKAEKEEFAKVTITTETAEIMVKYDSAIARIREQIQELEE